ncbi:methyltransferase [Crocinitomix algicola]|uniref:methyltransferase n=1 Tax=Crocinitomix algicola TaxID=1740263 RepID=UPI000871DFBA|nr:methyltransferase [Crocinitomix algicola]
MSKNYWNNRWKNRETGWDIGAVSAPLKAYFDQIEDKSLRILIPGCGSAYEAEYLMENGFSNTHIVEISPEAVKVFKNRYPSFPKHQIFEKDFFELNEKFDLIVEQTFFCAIPPSMRTLYVEKMHDLLNENGKLIGLLFDFPLDQGPPYGGSKKEYTTLFEPYFELEKLEQAYNSIPPRAGREFFINFRKKGNV